MGRIPQQKNAKQGAGPVNNAVRGAKVAKQRKKHKLVFESTSNKDDEDAGVVVSKDHRADRSIKGAHLQQLSFHTDPPPGYTFIPAGNTQLTAAMKVFAKRGQHKIMAVSATPHATRHELSREVHRVGYHFPTQVVDQVCSHYGIRLDSSGRLIGENDSEKLFMKISQKGQVVLNEKIRDQVTINTEAKEIIRDLFPQIPDNDLFQIIKTAFQLGDNKVGTADEIPLVRRAQLAVVAHIRHNYTNYDKLLRQVPYNDARHMVEKATLKRLVEWRGDDKSQNADGKRAVDEAVREVVVLSDEDESESELEEGQVVEGKHDAMEVDSVRKIAARPVITTEHRAVSPGEMSSEEEPPRGYRYAPPPPRQRVVAPSRADAQARQQSRYAVWDQVRQEHWAMPSYENTSTVLSRIPLVDSRLPQTDLVYIQPHQPGRDVTYMSQRPTSYVYEDSQPVRVIRERSPPTIFRGPDGRLFENVTHTPNGTYSPHRVYTPPTRAVAPGYPVQPRRSASPRPNRHQYHQRTPSMVDDGTIVQSIEGPESTNPSPAVYQRPFEPAPRRVYVENGITSQRTERPGRLIDLTDSAEQATMQMRPSTPPSPFLTRPRQERRSPAEITNTDRRRELIDLSPRVPPDIRRLERPDDQRVVYLEPEERDRWDQPRADRQYEDRRVDPRPRPVQVDYAMPDYFPNSQTYVVQNVRARHEPLDRHHPTMQEPPPARGPRDQNIVYMTDYPSQPLAASREMIMPTRMELEYQVRQDALQQPTQPRRHQGHPTSSARHAFIR